MADALDQLAQRAPNGAIPTAGSQMSPAPPAAAPASPAAPSSVGPARPAAGAAGGGDLLDALAKNPSLATPAPIKEPGGFGPFDESESHLFLGPFEKGLAESQKDWGLTTAAPEGLGDVAGQIWDSLVEGGKSHYKALREGLFKSAPGTPEENQGPMVLGAGVATPVAMMQSGLVGLLKMPGEATQMIADALQHPEPDAEGVSGHQRLGRGIGHMVNFLAQMATLKEGGEFGQAAATGKLGEFMEKRAAGPGNAMVRARKANFAFGKNPGDYLVDEPVKPPINLTRLGQLENVHAQNVAHGNALHSGVQDLLKAADTVQAVMPNGAVQRVPHLLDWATEVEDAAEETKRDLQRQSGAPNRAKIAKAVNEMRDDILQEHDVDGNPTGGKARQAVPTQVNEIKKSLGGRPNWKLITDPDAAEMAGIKDRFAKRAYGKLNDLVDNAVGGAPGKRVRELNRRYSNAIEFRQLLEDEILKEKGTGGDNALRRKLEWLGGAGGLASPNPVTQFIGAAAVANRVARSVPGRVVRARTMGMAGRALQSPAGRATAGAAGTAAGAIPAVSGAARRALAGQEVEP